MKSSLIFGFLFLIIGGILAYVQYTDQSEAILTASLITGILLGVGAGLIVGAIMGYSSKAQSVRSKNVKLKEAEAINKSGDTSGSL